MAGGAFIAVLGWIQISQLSKLVLFRITRYLLIHLPEQHPLAKTDQIALWIQCSLFSFLAVLAVFGWAHTPSHLPTMPKYDYLHQIFWSRDQKSSHDIKLCHRPCDTPRV